MITPSQTVGPYFAYGLTAEQYGYMNSQIANGNLLQGNKSEGKKIRIIGKVLDGENKPVNDAMIEIWQPDENGDFFNPDFRGFGRMGTGTTPDNHFEFLTIKPGANGDDAPCILVIVFMRGMLIHLYTRIYFNDEFLANEKDPVLGLLNEDRRKTLIATRKNEEEITEYHFDIHLQGENETVFFKY